MMQTNKEKAPTGSAKPDVGAQNYQQIQNTPGTCSRQELKDFLVTFAMTVAGLRIALAKEYGEAEAYKMLIKSFQLGCMDQDTIHAEGQAARAYFAKEGQA